MERWIKAIGIAVSLCFGGSFLFRMGFYKAIAVPIVLLPLQPFDITKDIALWPFVAGLGTLLYLGMGFAQVHLLHSKRGRKELMPLEYVLWVCLITIVTAAFIKFAPFLVFLSSTACFLITTWCTGQRMGVDAPLDGVDRGVLLSGIVVGIAALIYVIGFTAGSNLVNDKPQDFVAVKDRPSIHCTILSTFDSGLLIAVNRYVVFIPREEILGINFAVDRSDERKKMWERLAFPFPARDKP